MKTSIPLALAAAILLLAAMASESSAEKGNTKVSCLPMEFLRVSLWFRGFIGNFWLGWIYKC